MLTRLGQVLASVALCIALPAGVALSAAQREVPAPLMAAAECMARTLRTVPGVSAVEITVPEGDGMAYPLLQYRDVDGFGGRHFAEVSLFEITGAEEPYVFDWGDVDDDPAAQKVLALWKSRCHAAGGYITSIPG